LTPHRLGARRACCPALAAFLDEAEAALAGSGREALWACEPAFVALLETDFVRALLDAELAAIVAEPTHIVEDSSRFSWALAGTARLELALLPLPVAEEERVRFLYGSPRHRLVAGLGPARVALYRHEQDHPSDVFDRSVALTTLGERGLGPGEVLALRAFRDVLDPLPAPRAYLVELSSTEQDRLRWTYARDSLRPHSPTPASRSTNLIEYAVWALVQLGHPDPLPALRRVAEHPVHHVRWTAIRAAIEVDPAAGRALLERATEDPHPHVRDAARRGLRALEARGG
jgi:HEAT repeats